MTALADALSALLDAAADSLSDPPERRYVSAGEPAVDCALLAAYPGDPRTVTLAQPGDLPAPRRQPRVRVVPLHVELWQPVCAAATPSVIQLHADGIAHADAGWELYAGLLGRLERGEVFDGEYQRAADVDVGEVRDPRGGYAGWRVRVTVAL